MRIVLPSSVEFLSIRLRMRFASNSLRVAEEQSVGIVSNVNTPRKVPIASRVPVELAEEVARMAEAGNRTVSREVWGALAKHVAESPRSSRGERGRNRGASSSAAAAAPRRGER